MSYERREINPGSSAEFAEAYKQQFLEQGSHFVESHSLVTPAGLGAPATAEVIKIVNDQPPTLTV